ncbi:MAG: MMPL family transporter, partial [Candidatus Geothermincolales bacterium]
FLRIEEVFGAQDTALVVLEGRDMLSPENLEVMETFVREAVDDPRNRREDGGYKYLDPSRTNSLPGIFALAGGGLPANSAQAEEYLGRLEREFGFEASSLVSPDRSSAIIVFQVPFVDEKGEKEMASILQDKVSEIRSKYGVQAEATGTPLIVSDAIGRLFSTQLRTGGLALLLCALLVMVIFRSVAYGLMATSVVFLAIVLELGLLRIIGWPLDIMTVMIASMVIGAGIDFGIHVAHRFREEVRERGMEPEEGVNATVRNVGAALIPGALTTAGAFLILALSSLSPLRRFGVITALALIGACFSAMVIEPTFLTTYEVARRRFEVARKRFNGNNRVSETFSFCPSNPRRWKGVFGVGPRGPGPAEGLKFSRPSLRERAAGRKVAGLPRGTDDSKAETRRSGLTLRERFLEYRSHIRFSDLDLASRAMTLMWLEIFRKRVFRSCFPHVVSQGLLREVGEVIDSIYLEGYILSRAARDEGWEPLSFTDPDIPGSVERGVEALRSMYEEEVVGEEPFAGEPLGVESLAESLVREIAAYPMMQRLEELELLKVHLLYALWAGYKLAEFERRIRDKGVGLGGWR